MGRDSNASADFNAISIHSPRVGRDRANLLDHFIIADFNHFPINGERRHPTDICWDEHNFNPLSPCGETFYLSKEWRHLHFNPLSPCGRDDYYELHNLSVLDFNPLSPCGERRYRCNSIDGLAVSIHSPCGEGALGTQSSCSNKISIHSPRVGRAFEPNIPENPDWFQSTLPV